MTKRIAVMATCDFCGVEHPEETQKISTFPWSWEGTSMEIQVCVKDKRRVKSLTIGELIEASHEAIPESSMPKAKKPAKKKTAAKRGPRQAVTAPVNARGKPTVEERMKPYLNEDGTYHCPRYPADCDKGDIVTAVGLVMHYRTAHKVSIDDLSERKPSTGIGKSKARVKGKGGRQRTPKDGGKYTVEERYAQYKTEEGWKCPSCTGVVRSARGLAIHHGRDHKAPLPTIEEAA